MIVVSDTSSITNLYAIGLLDLLCDLFGVITITPSVQRELYVLADQAIYIDHLDWIKVKSPRNQEKVADLLKELELGEAESIVLAIECQAQYLLIDEYKGRRIAQSHGINIVGVLGILILSKKKGLIPSVKTHIENLKNFGFRLDRKLVDKVLKISGEL